MSIKKKDLDAIIKKEETFEHLHNSKPVTRRDFLATGLLPFAASMMAPSALQLISSQAFGADSRCAQGSSAADIPGFINIDLSGGSGLYSHALPLDGGGQLLSSYSKLGLGLGSRLPVVNEFGNSIWYRDSTLLAGIKSRASVETLAKVSFVGLCSKIQDDTSSNKMDISGLVDKMRTGGLLPTLNQNKNSAAFSPPKPSVSVSKFSDVNNAILLGGRLAGSLNQQQEQRLLRMVSSLSTSQGVKLSSFTGGSELHNLISCAGIKNVDLIGKEDLGTNPIANGSIASAWGVNNNTGDGDANKVFSSIVFNVLNGNASLGNIRLGGYDYHNGTRTSGDTKDNSAGQIIGRVLETAAIMGKKIFLTVTTDGGVRSAQSDDAGAPWVSDGGSNGFSYMFAYDPDVRPAVKAHNVGSYTSGQTVSDTSIVSGSAQMGAAGIFANYLAFCGKLGEFEAIAGKGIISKADLEDIAMFG